MIKYETTDKSRPYQCEVVSHLDFVGGKIKRLKFYFEKGDVQGEDGRGDLVEMVANFFLEANKVFIISPEGYERYFPV